MSPTLMVIIETLAPLILVIGLGTILARIRFLGREFMADLNKLAFWIALPCLLFSSALKASWPGGILGTLVLVMVAATLAITGIAWLVSIALGAPPSIRGTLMQASFRGNLAYIGVPVLAYGFGDNKETLALTVILMVFLMSSYNILAVFVLQSGTQQKTDWRKMAASLFGNPLLIAGVLGLSFSLFGIHLPVFFTRSLDCLGASAVPIASLCIGGSLAITSLSGRFSWIFAAALLKVAGVPLLVWLMVRYLGLGLDEQRIALVLACCPTAAASYIMAREMGGDEALASGSIALSTILCAPALAVALWITG